MTVTVAVVSDVTTARTIARVDMDQGTSKRDRDASEENLQQPSDSPAELRQVGPRQLSASDHTVRASEVHVHEKRKTWEPLRDANPRAFERRGPPGYTGKSRCVNSGCTRRLVAVAPCG